MLCNANFGIRVSGTAADSLHCSKNLLQDAPLITNVGTEFQIRPVNYFDQLASVDVEDANTFAVCAPVQGEDFDYSYDPVNGRNSKFDKMDYKYQSN